MKIKIYYDYLCPFCYIGSMRIKEIATDYTLELEWKGIEIHPEYPPSGKKRKKTLHSALITEKIKDMSSEDGLSINLPGLLTNTRLVLEAAVFAKEESSFPEFHYSVYEAYFHDGVNIGDKKEILKIAQKAGLDVERLETALDKRTYSHSIDGNQLDAETDMILGVPTFVINRFPIYGAQSSETLKKIIDKFND